MQTEIDSNVTFAELAKLFALWLERQGGRVTRYARPSSPAPAAKRIAAGELARQETLFDEPAE